MAAAIDATTSPLRNVLPGRQIPSTGQQWFNRRKLEMPPGVSAGSLLMLVPRQLSHG
jgi:hypothetical protein